MDDGSSVLRASGNVCVCLSLANEACSGDKYSRHLRASPTARTAARAEVSVSVTDIYYRTIILRVPSAWRSIQRVASARIAPTVLGCYYSHNSPATVMYDSPFINMGAFRTSYDSVEVWN